LLGVPLVERPTTSGKIEEEKQRFPDKVTTDSVLLK